MHGWSWIQRRKWVSRRIVHSLPTNCSQMLMLGNWTTRYSMFSEQTCTINHQMDQSMWQTTISFDLLHSSHMWIQAILFCVKHSTTLQIRIVPRLWFCRRRWRLEIDFRENFVLIWKSHVCSHKLDVQEADLFFTQFYGSWGNFSRCRFTHGWDSRSRPRWFSNWSSSFLTEPNQQDQRSKRSTGELVGNSSTKHAKTNTNHEHQSRSDQHWCCSIKRNTFWFQCYVVYVFEDNEDVIKMTIKGRSPTIRHVSRTHRVALDWLFDRNNHDSRRQIRNIDTKQQLADILIKVISHVTNGTIFFICSTSVFQLYLLR